MLNPFIIKCIFQDLSDTVLADNVQQYENEFKIYDNGFIENMVWLPYKDNAYYEYVTVQPLNNNFIMKYIHSSLPKSPDQLLTMEHQWGREFDLSVTYLGFRVSNGPVILCTSSNALFAVQQFRNRQPARTRKSLHGPQREEEEKEKSAFKRSRTM